MNLLIVPISKTGERKVGIKVTGANNKFLDLLKRFEFDKMAVSSEFEYFFHFCGDLRVALIGTEYKSIELTDGYDVQEFNYYIDYSKSPVAVVIEDRHGFPCDLSSFKFIKYQKSPTQVVRYQIEKILEDTKTHLKCLVRKGENIVPRNFLVDKIIEREGF